MANTKGFTLVEILVVVGLIAIVSSVGLFVSMETYHNSSFHNSRDLFISALQHARAEAVNNVCTGICTDGKPHGVHISTDGTGNVDKFIVFQGTVYNPVDTTNVSFEIKKNVTAVLKSTGLTDVVFSQLSGDAVSSGSITFTDNLNETSIITIGSEGQISWTN